MAWFIVLSVFGIIFIILGTFIVYKTMKSDVSVTPHGWAFVILGICLVIAFGIIPNIGENSLF